MLIGISERMPKEIKGPLKTKKKEKVDFRKAVIPYSHKVSHHITDRWKTWCYSFVFHDKVKGLCSAVNKNRKFKKGCTVLHKDTLAQCAKNVIDWIPLTCCKEQIDQTGRGVNEQLCEHRYTYQRLQEAGHLASHCRRCSCTPLFGVTEMPAHGGDKDVIKIKEALYIIAGREKCVNMLSTQLTQAEMSFLQNVSFKPVISVNG